METMSSSRASWEIQAGMRGGVYQSLALREKVSAEGRTDSYAISFNQREYDRRSMRRRSAVRLLCFIAAASARARFQPRTGWRRAMLWSHAGTPRKRWSPPAP